MQSNDKVDLILVPHTVEFEFFNNPMKSDQKYIG